MKRYFANGLLAASILCIPLLSSAADTDLFVGATPAATSEVPNVLLLVDNTANWNTAFTNEMAALVSTLNGLSDGKFRVGIMMFTETGGGNTGSDGGYVRAAIRLMDGTNKPIYQALVNSFNKVDDKSNGGKAALMMAEAYRYFSAGSPYAGNNKNKTDYSGNTSGAAQSNAIYALTGNALTSKGGSTYSNPVTAGCQKNYIIYISNGPAQENTSDTTTATSLLSSAGGNTTAIPISPSGSQSSVADEWTRWMKQSSLGIVTYTLDVDPGTTGQGPGWTALLKSMAGVGGGKYYSVTSGNGGADISSALGKAFSEIQAVNSVFAAVSLPVSVNTQGTYLNQVYVGMFRPDPDSYPRWAGNLKQYKMGKLDGSLKLLDADSASAINSQTGFITECARSFWTPSATDTYWTFRPQGNCIPPGGSSSTLYMNSNYPDGNVVEKGAQAYKQRSTTTRAVKTCSPTFASCTSLTDFDTSNAAITQGLLGAASSTERDTLINWGRGQDLDDENINATTSTETRASVHGDVVHSRPVAINFGTDGSPLVVVFYGDNGGMLRAINGNRTANIGTATPGSELWSFVAPETYTNFKRIRDNTVQVSAPNIAGGSPKAYGFDGPMTAYKDSSRAWLYATMRRGGRTMYAFDVTNPSSPSLKWKVGCPNNFPTSGTVSDTDCSAGFSGIGQTWSSPKSFFATHYGASQPLLMMGGGYDTCEDSDPSSCAGSTKGNKIYIMDADAGTLVKTFDTDRAVVGDVIIATDNDTGYAKYAYAADLGGNMYRISIGSGAPSSWSITKIASLGCSTVTSCSPSRKFMFGPDAVEDNGTYYLLLGSGDREKPLTYYASAASVTNYFFMVKDKPTDSAWLSSESTNCSGNSVICLNSLTGITTTTPDQAVLDAKKGWYLGLAATEQVVTSAITLFDVVTFSTHTPAVVASGSCSSNLGTAKVYNIGYTNAAATGSSRYQTISGGGLPPSPVAGQVTLDDGSTVPFVIGSSASSPLEASEGNPGSSTSVNLPKNRVYWYIQQ